MTWFPNKPPLYDINKSYAHNAEFGPFFAGVMPVRPKVKKLHDFLGFPVASPLGIPAGPLLTSKWIALAAQLGFDIVTYKTIRSDEHAGHPLPNMIFVETQGTQARQVAEPSRDIASLAVTNSFGMPSKSPTFLMEDIDKANRSLHSGQVMIVSIVGSPRSGQSFIDDFVKTALLAKEAGAHIIEANFSCPNVAAKDGCLYVSPETVFTIGSAIAKAIHPVPLILKMGLFPDPTLMRASLISAAKAGARAVCGINTISMRVLNDEGKPALGENRPTSGICGGPIREAALQFIRDAAAINKQDKLDLVIMGCGGITLPEHFDAFLEAGAEVAMSATGMMWDPYLAAKYHERQV